MLLQRRFSQGTGQPLSQPRIERIELHDQGVQGPSLGFGVAPFDIEPALDAAAEQKWYPRFTRHPVGGPSQQIGCTLDDLAGGVPQQVDGVLDPPGSDQGTGVHSNPQRLGQLLRVKRIRTAGQFNGPLEQSKIEIGPNQPRAKVDQSTLGEGGFIFSEPVENICHRRSITVRSTASASEMPW